MNHPEKHLMKAAIAGLLLTGAGSAQAPPLSEEHISPPDRVALEQGCRASKGSLDKFRSPTPAAAEQPNSTVDGLVKDLNSTTFQALASIKKRNPGPLSEKDALELKAAVVSDQALDAAERDLLEELLQSKVRSITVSEPGQTNNRLVLFPVSGQTRTVLLDALYPPLDLAQEWDKGAPGYANIVAYCRQFPPKEPSVLGFVQQKLAESWHESSRENAYKPLRERIGEIYDWALKCKGDVPMGRAILATAMEKLDQAESDAIPDFLYNWILPSK